MTSTKCPNCGNLKKPWFKLCYDCTIKEKQKPTCEICGKEVPDGHNLCKEHWKQKQEEKKKIIQVDYVKKKKETDFRKKYEGKYLYNNIKFKSKSEVIIYLFLKQNELDTYYEEEINLHDHVYHPDFVIEDKNKNTIILEHFGLEEINYKKTMVDKIREFTELAKKEEKVFFIYTTEEDLTNLKDKLGKKLNSTPLSCFRWK